MASPLEGQIALVAGATRAAGRGIAQELAAAGAKVSCTGRSVRGAPATPGRPETIEETADLIAADGGSAVAIRVDHTVEAEVEALAARIKADEGRLDILVNDIWGGDELIDWGAPFWKADMAAVRTLVDRAVLSHWITARHLASMMVEAGRGLIVEVTDGDSAGYRGQLLYDFCKASANRLAYALARDPALDRPRHRGAGGRPGGVAQGRRGALCRRPGARLRLHRPRRHAAALLGRRPAPARGPARPGWPARPRGLLLWPRPLHEGPSRPGPGRRSPPPRHPPRLDAAGPRPAAGRRSLVQLPRKQTTSPAPRASQQRAAGGS